MGKTTYGVAWQFQLLQWLDTSREIVGYKKSKHVWDIYENTLRVTTYEVMYGWFV